MDDLDLRIFRWMYAGGVWSWWGTDPRITTPEIASQVGLERTAVWARIRNWRREGFWNGFEVHPNPQIFGVGQVRVEIQVSGPAEGTAVLDELEHVEGVLWARVVFGTSAHGREGEAVLAALVAEDATGVRRRIRILRRLSTGGSMEGPFRDPIPTCSHPLSPLDWRILAAAFSNPNASLARLARLVGVTLKTLAHHHALLIERHALFYLPTVDWAKLCCVILGVVCRSTADVGPVRAELEVRFPALIPMSLEGFEALAPGWDSSTCFSVMVPAYSPHGVHALVRDVSRIPGVSLVRSETWGPERLYHDWVDRRIAEHIVTAVTPARESVRPVGARKRSGHGATAPAENRGAVAH